MLTRVCVPLSQWSLSSDRTWTRLWPVTVGNLLHIHMPLVILAVLSVEFVILCRRGQVARRSVCVAGCLHAGVAPLHAHT